MRHFILTLRHPLFGFATTEFGAFDETRARVLATRSIGVGYKLISIKEVK